MALLPPSRRTATRGRSGTATRGCSGTAITGPQWHCYQGRSSTATTGTLPSFSYIDHFPVFVSLNIEKPLPLKPQEMRIWDYSRTDINKLTSTLIQTDWNFIEEKNIHDATEQFTQTIWMAATDAIPMKIIKRRQDDKIWVTAEL